MNFAYHKHQAIYNTCRSGGYTQKQIGDYFGMAYIIFKYVALLQNTRPRSLVKAAPKMVTRFFKWGKNCKTAGEVKIAHIALYLGEYCPTEEIMAFLNKLANKLINVPKYLQEQGCPKEILNFPSIGFNFTEQKLQRMGVINA